MKKIVIFTLLSIVYLFADAKIFIYHRFGDSRYESANVSIKALRTQFEYFKKNNYEVVPLNRVIYKLKKGEELPINWVVLTIDDAYKSFYENGFALFKEFNYPFSLFVYVEATNKNFGDFMNWSQLKEMDDYGATIGLHSYSHKHLVSLDSSDIIEDTKKSIEIFKKNMGFTPLHYAYPYGEYDSRVKSIIKNFGFLTILNQSVGAVNIGSDIYDLDRVAVDTSSNIENKLNYKKFNANILEPLDYPKDGIIKRVKASFSKELKRVNLYISGYGWSSHNVENGLLDIEVNKKITNKRVRVIIGESFFKVKSKLLVKTN